MKMNQKLKAMALVVGMICLGAQANVGEANEEVASQKARLTEFAAEGEIAPGLEKTAVLYRDEQGRAVQILFSEEKLIDGKVRMVHKTFDIVNPKRSIGCGSVRYTAVEQVAGRVLPHQIDLDDHAQRFCEDYRKYQWDLRMTRGGQDLRIFGGNPEVMLAARLPNFKVLEH